MPEAKYLVTKFNHPLYQSKKNRVMIRIEKISMIGIWLATAVALLGFV
jgi:hypothetical protein